MALTHCATSWVLHNICLSSQLLSCAAPPFFCLSTGSSLSSPDLSSATEGAKDAADSAADDIKGAASDLKAKAKGALSGLSALPNNIATVADQNADVRGLAGKYRDPAGAIQQDKAAGGFGSMRGMLWLTCHQQMDNGLQTGSLVQE